jgi:hypothetical protein
MLRLLREQLPSLAGAMLIAELFYEWHSFTLQCLGFLATWAALNFILQMMMRGRTADSERGSAG